MRENRTKSLGSLQCLNKDLSLYGIQEGIHIDPTLKPCFVILFFVAFKKHLLNVLRFFKFLQIDKLVTVKAILLNAILDTFKHIKIFNY